MLSIKIGDYPLARLNIGDVAFVPAGVPFTYYSEVAWTKVLYVSGGTRGVDSQLISKAKKWNWVTFPTA